VSICTRLLSYPFQAIALTQYRETFFSRIRQRRGGRRCPGRQGVGGRDGRPPGRPHYGGTRRGNWVVWLRASLDAAERWTTHISECCDLLDAMDGSCWWAAGPSQLASSIGSALCAVNFLTVAALTHSCPLTHTNLASRRCPSLIFRQLRPTIMDDTQVTASDCEDSLESLGAPSSQLSSSGALIRGAVSSSPSLSLQKRYAFVSPLFMP
jgi:hypothetical protein